MTELKEMSENILAREAWEKTPHWQRKIIILGQEISAKDFSNGNPELGVGTRSFIRGRHCSGGVIFVIFEGQEKPKSAK